MGHARNAWLKEGGSEWGWKFRLQYAEMLYRTEGIPELQKVLKDPLPLSPEYQKLKPRHDFLQAILDLYLRKPSAPLELTSAVAAAHAKSDPDTEAAGLLKIASDLQEGKAPEKYSKHALALALQHHLSLRETEALNSLGYIALRREHYADAIQYLKDAAYRAKAINAAYIQAAALSNLGECYFRVGDLSRALGSFNEANPLLRSSDRSQLAVNVHNQIGTLYSLMRQDQEALKYYRSAFAVAQKTGGASRRYYGSAIRLSAGLIETHDSNAAEQYNEIAQRSLQDAVKKGSTPLPGYFADCELNRANIAADRGQLKAAETSYQNVLGMLGGGTPNSTQWSAYAQLARLDERLHKMSEAQKNYANALTAIESNRAQQVSAGYQITFLSALIQFYQQYVDFLMRQNQPWVALSVADSSRASVLTGGSMSSRVQANFVEGLASQARASNTALLFYWLAPQASYVWIITPAKKTFKILPVPRQKIEDDIRSYSAFIQNEREDTLRNSKPVGFRLFQTLIAPVAECIQPGMRVVIVPDGPLNGLNFETLLVPGNRPHYWLEDVTVTIAPSLGILLAESKGVNKTERALIIGDAIYDGKDYPGLPESRNEVAKVSARFPNNRKVLTQTQASAEAYRRARPELFSLIHFSTHVDANRDSPLDSAIILSPGKDGSRQLYARDFMTNTLNADLVTVSGCRSAGRQELSGEGLVGFAWAAFKAGARNAVTSLWEVDDRSTAELMDHFYIGVTQEKTYATALRDAKLEMLKSKPKPFYWAPFQLYSRSLSGGRQASLHHVPR